MRTLIIRGGEYNGTVLNGKANGRGTLTFKSGAKYIGLFKDNMYHGKGTHKDGNSTYEGEWVGDHRHGEGVFDWGDGRNYKGQW